MKKEINGNKPPLVNIVILTFNQFGFIGECLEALKNCNYPNLRILLVDNNSNLDAYKKFREKYKNNKQTEFFRLNENKGFAGGCNYALRKIKSGYIVLLNDDVIVTKNWLQPIIKYMESNPDVGACQPKIKSNRDKTYFEYAGAAGGFMDVYGFPFARGRVFFVSEKDKGQYDSVADLVWCSGACMVTKYEVIKKVGIFDEIFFIYGEEADLCWRMNFYGYRLTFLPSSIVYHHGSGTMSKFQFKKTYLHHRNGLLLMLKNFTAFEIIRYLPFRILLDHVAFWYYILENKKTLNALAVVMAHARVISLIPYILRRRDHLYLKLMNKTRPPYPLYKDSIIIDYFLRGKKKFSQLNTKSFINQ